MQFTRHKKALRAALLVLAPAMPLFVSTALADAVFEVRVGELRTICGSASSQICSRAVYGFLDDNRDNRLTLDEVQSAQTHATSAVQNRQNGLTADERVLFGLALIGMKSAGAAQVFTNFDTDGDGDLSHGELFADVKLDNRPFAVLANDPDAVDWRKLAGRFGAFGQSLVGMLPANTGK